jgi:hypothetical protein
MRMIEVSKRRFIGKVYIKGIGGGEEFPQTVISLG